MTQPQRRPASSSPDPVLITDAARSYEEDLRVRKRRYALMMGMRVPCMVLAAIFYETPWLAVTLLIISIPLPWMAVLIANDRLPRKSEKVNRYEADRPALEARTHGARLRAPRRFDGPVIDGDVLTTATSHRAPRTSAAPADGLRARGAARQQRRFRARAREPRREQPGVERVAGARRIATTSHGGERTAWTCGHRPDPPSSRPPVPP